MHNAIIAGRYSFVPQNKRMSQPPAAAGRVKYEESPEEKMDSGGYSFVPLFCELCDICEASPRD